MRLAACLSCLILALPPLGAGEAEGPDQIIATEWSIRQEISELFDQLENVRGDPAPLFDRVVDLLRTKGSKIFRYRGVYMTASEAVRRHIDHLGLRDAFDHHVDPRAARRMEELVAAGDWEGLRLLAGRYPGTPTARRAWALLADRSWDMGRIGLYITYGRRAGEREDPERAERLDTAIAMLRPEDPEPLPSNLRELGEAPMWRLDLPVADAPEPDPRDPRLRGRVENPKRIGFAPAGHRLAVTDGARLRIVDPLIGQVIGDQLDFRASRTFRDPAHHRGEIFVAVGIDDYNNLVALAADGTGRKLWRVTQEIPAAGQLSDPVISDGIVAVAEVRNRTEGSELHLHALDLADGSLAWSILIGQSNSRVHPLMRHRMPDLATRPSLILHAGSFAICSNTGILAQVEADGTIRNIFPYSRQAPMAGMPGRRDVSLRPGRLATDGRMLIAAPADSHRVTVVDTVEDAVRTYQGEGARDQLIGARDGAMLLAGRRLTQVDLADLETRWSHRLPETEPVRWARIDSDHVLLTQGQLLSQYRWDDGGPVASRSLPATADVTVAGEVLVVARDGQLRGYGDSEHFLARLRKAVEEDPHDYRPLVALHSLHYSRGDNVRAYDLLLRALENGAPRSWAVKAADIWRLSLQGHVGHEDFPGRLVQGERLLPHLPELAAEMAWWHGLHHEALGANERAVARFREVLENPDHHVHMGAIEADLHALARAGLHRLDAGPPPTWMRPLPAPGGEAVDVGRWEDDRHRLGRPLLAHGRAFSYADGNVIAQSLADGSIVWKRGAHSGLRPMLGLSHPAVARVEPGRVVAHVIPGTSAALAGIRDGDVIESINGREVRNFNDVADQVARLDIGGRFTIEVVRDGERRRIEGELGTWFTRLIAADDRFLVVQRAGLNTGEPDRITAHPDDPRIDVLDAKSGELLHQFHPQPVQQFGYDPEPLVTGDHVLVIPEAGDIVAYDLEDGGRERWRIGGVAEDLPTMTRIAPRTAILLRRAIARAQIVDLASGSTLFSVPCDPDTEFLADAGLLTARGRDGRLRTWDLGHARPLWHSRLEGLEPVARAGDGVFALTVGGELVLLDRRNGSTRQAYRKWTFVTGAVPIGDLLALHVRKVHGDAIAAIGLGSGRVLWETDLPAGLEVHGDLRANGERIVAELRHLEEPPSLFIVDDEGKLLGGHRFDRNESPLITGDAILFTGPEGLRSVRPGTREEAAAPVPATRIPAEGDFAASLPDPEELHWQELEGSSYAIGLRGEHLVGFARFPAEGGARRTEIRLAHAATRPWQESQAVRIDRGGSPELTGRDRGWRILDSRRLELGEGEWGAAVLLAPPILRDPLATFHCRASSDRDGDDAPWWLPSTWREIAPP